MLTAVSIRFGCKIQQTPYSFKRKVGQKYIGSALSRKLVSRVVTIFNMKPVNQVLLVEDNELFRDALREIIAARFPHIVIENAGDGDEARKKIAASRPDLILMDIALPGKNGLQLTKEIKASHGDIKIVILTGLGDGYEKAAQKYGADGYLIKGLSSLDEILVLFGQASPCGG